MGNSLFEKFQTIPQATPPITQQFNTFLQSLDPGVRNSPQQTVQQLLNSGRMTRNQFDQFRQIANQITGKNY